MSKIIKNIIHKLYVQYYLINIHSRLPNLSKKIFHLNVFTHTFNIANADFYEIK